VTLNDYLAPRRMILPVALISAVIFAAPLALVVFGTAISKLDVGRAAVTAAAALFPIGWGALATGSLFFGIAGAVLIQVGRWLFDRKPGGADPA